MTFHQDDVERRFTQHQVRGIDLMVSTLSTSTYEALVVVADQRTLLR